MNFRTSRILMWVMICTGLALGMLQLREQSWQYVVGGILVFGGFLQAFAFYRCPYCGKSLLVELKTAMPTRCPSCGKALPKKGQPIQK